MRCNDDDDTPTKTVSIVHAMSLQSGSDRPTETVSTSMPGLSNPTKSLVGRYPTRSPVDCSNCRLKDSTLTRRTGAMDSINSSNNSIGTSPTLLGNSRDWSFNSPGTNSHFLLGEIKRLTPLSSLSLPSWEAMTIASRPDSSTSRSFRKDVNGHGEVVLNSKGDGRARAVPDSDSPSSIGLNTEDLEALREGWRDTPSV